MQLIRAATYLCPSVPVGLVQELLGSLERHTGLSTTLLYEWRADGPTSDPSRPDLFEHDLVDIAFVPSSGYVALAGVTSGRSYSHAHLLPLAPVFARSAGDGSCSAHVDIVVHADKLKHNVSQILDLRGCSWACTPEGSLAHTLMLNALLELGENMTFFGTTYRTDSHLASVNMVMSKQAEAATVDAAALTCNRRFLHNGAKDVVVLCSLGATSPYAILVNSRMPIELQRKIIEAFSDINDREPHFEKFGLIKFAPNDDSKYDQERLLMRDIESKNLSVPYY